MDPDADALTDDEFDAATRPLRALLRATARRCYGLLEAGDVVDSQAHSDRDGRPPLAGPDSPLGFLHDHAWATWYAATEHLQSLARLLESPPFVYAPDVIMRAAVEASSRCWWLLEPGMTDDNRARRGFRLAIENTWNMHRANRGDTAMQSLVSGFLELSEATGIGLTCNREGIPTGVEGVELPGPTELAAQLMVALVRHRDREQAMQYARQRYTLLAAASHADPWVILSRFASDDGEEASNTRLYVYEALEQAVSTILCYQSATTRVVDYFGWDADAWRRWSRHIDIKVVTEFPAHKWLRDEVQTASRDLSEDPPAAP